MAFDSISYITIDTPQRNVAALVGFTHPLKLSYLDFAAASYGSGQLIFSISEGGNEKTRSRCLYFFSLEFCLDFFFLRGCFEQTSLLFVADHTRFT